MLIGVILASALVAVALVALLGRTSGTASSSATYEGEERAHMPAELATAKLVLSETTVRADHPVPLVAKPDQVFQTMAGESIVVENKSNRHRGEVYLKDVIQLSVQAHVLRHANDRRLRFPRVATRGYVRITAPGRPPRYLPVQLLDEPSVIAYYQRVRDLQARRSAPTPPADRRVCSGCGHKGRCPAYRS